MGYVPARRLVANKIYLLCSLLAHNLSRELQMQVGEPVRGTTQKRTVKWLFEELDTLRHGEPGHASGDWLCLIENQNFLRGMMDSTSAS